MLVKQQQMKKILAAGLAALWIGVGMTGCSLEAAEGMLKQAVDTVQQELFFEEDRIDPVEVNGLFYYELLTEEEQLVYREILQGIRAESNEIYVHLADGERAMDLFQLVLNDFPGIFWCTGESSVSYNEEDSVFFSYSILKPVYEYTGEERTKRQQTLNAAVEQILKKAPVDGSDYDKVQYVYESVILSTNYVENSPDNQNLYSVLVNGESVCAGYARATQYLLEQLGIPCIYVLGEATGTDGSDGAPHAWNIVYCQENYYQVDSTWGDPTYLEAEGDEAAVAADEIYYDFLLTADEHVALTHHADEQYPYPKCTDSSYYYYTQNGTYYESFTEEELMGTMERDIERKKEYTEFKFANAELYQGAWQAIEGGLQEEAALYICDYYDLEQSGYASMRNDGTCYIRLYWYYE